MPLADFSEFEAVDPFAEFEAVSNTPTGLAPLDNGETVNWGGFNVPRSRVQEVADRMGRSPEFVMALGTPGGRFASAFGTTVVGQTLLRAQQGLNDLAVAGLDLMDRAGVNFIGLDRERLQTEQSTWNELLTEAESRGDIQGVVGETGSRIYGNIIRSAGKVAAASPLGTIGIYSAIGGEAYDNSLVQAEAAGMGGTDAVVYAGKQAALELGLMAAMGGLASRFGARTLEETFTQGMQRAAAGVAERHGLTEGLKSFALGGTFEGAEESLTALGNQLIEMDAGLRETLDMGQVLEAGATGLFATAGTQGFQAFNSKLASDEFKQALEDSAIAVKDVSGLTNTRTREELEDIRDMSDDELKAEGIIPEDATPDYTATMRQEVEYEINLRQDKSAIATEVTGAPASSEGIPFPENKADQVALENFVLDTESMIRDPTLPRFDGLETTARHADTNRDSVILGFDSYFNPGGRSISVVDAEAKQKGIPEKALSIAQSSLQTGRILEDFEERGLTIKLAELKGRATDLSIKIEAATDSMDIESQGVELDRVAKQAQLLIEALARTGSKASYTMLARKQAVGNDNTPIGVIARAVSAKKDVLTDDEATAFRKKGVKHEAAAAKVDAKQAEVSGKQAYEVLKRMPGEITTDEVRSLYDIVRELFEGGCDF